ncbi:MAG: Transcriptional regulator, family [Pedosphaera sp.]|nr:Transcriptional regulator, family [Pedosphaera sp.]
MFDVRCFPIPDTKLAPVSFHWLTEGMNLEDHLGDIIRKGRLAANVPAETAAQAAGLTAAELAALEASGQPAGQLNLPALATALGLHPAKLQSIAKGWRPAEKDLSIWRELRVFSTEQNGIIVNSYLVWDEVSREGALFDTGWNALSAIAAVEENQVQLRHIFLTHTHEDHIAGMAALREKFPKVHVHTNAKTAPPQSRNRANDFFHLGSLRITNRDTPGHAEDGVTYIIGTWPEDGPHVAMVGDAIFAGSIGTGFQSWDLAKQKVREQIFSLPPDTLICPGHGPLTTVAEEKANNPFFS